MVLQHTLNLIFHSSHLLMGGERWGCRRGQMVLQFQPTLNLMRGVWLKGVTGYTNLSLSLFIVNGLWFQPLIQITNVN